MKIGITAFLWIYKKIQESGGNLIAGEHEVRIKMTHNRVRTYMATGFSSSIENWDDEVNYPNTSHSKYKELSGKIDEMMADISFEIKLAEKGGRKITPIEIKTTLNSKERIVAIAEKPNRIMAYTKMVEEQYREADNHGYANVFYNCNLTLKKLLNDKDKMFLAFTKSDHEAYEKQLAGKAESTISNYLRTYYRVWNLAIADGLCSKDHHPKQFIKFKAYKKIRTKKRSIKADYWERILNLKIAANTRLYRSHLLMQFMYYARGMNFNDTLKLTWDNIQNNGVSYKRSKNKRHYDFELHPAALEIINIFKALPNQSDSGHIFPFIMKEHDTSKKIDARIDSALKDFNEDSKAIAGAIGWQKNFTSNALRHGFASHLNEADVGIKIIQEAMGHETQGQTRTYLDDIEDSVITKAINSALIQKKKTVK
ncbi:MAG TPA: tyrosine-type recombinase/integrase [Mucilaginibacter sp.]